MKLSLAEHHTHSWVKEDVFDWGGGTTNVQPKAAVRRICVLGEIIIIIIQKFFSFSHY